jgi:hypothetical protein
MTATLKAPTMILLVSSKCAVGGKCDRRQHGVVTGTAPRVSCHHSESEPDWYVLRDAITAGARSLCG